MLAMVALEEEAGKATNGLGFLVAQRAPVELLEIASPEQIERFVLPVFRHERHEAWAITEPGAGSDVSAIAATATREGDEWVLNGEKWFVTGGEKADYYLVLAGRRRRAGALLRRQGHARLRGRSARPRFMHDPYLYKPPRASASRTAACRTRTGCRAAGTRARRGGSSIERLMIAARCCGASQRLVDEATDWAKERRGVRSADRRLPGGAVHARRLAHRAPRRPPPHLPRGATRSTRSRTRRSSTARSRWRSSTPPRRPGGSPTAPSRSSAGAAT